MEIIISGLEKVQFEVKTPTTIKDIKDYFEEQGIMFNDHAILKEFKSDEQYCDFSLPGIYKRKKGNNVTLYGFELNEKHEEKNTRTRIILRRAACIPHEAGVNSIPFEKLKNLLSSNQQNPNLIYDIFIESNIGEVNNEAYSSLVLGRIFQSKPLIRVSEARHPGSLVDKLVLGVNEILVPEGDQLEMFAPDINNLNDALIGINSKENGNTNTHYKKLMDSYALMAKIIGEAIES
jgi:hypothetical protein